MDKNNKHKKGRIRYFTISTRLTYKEKNKFLRYCKKANLTPSEILRLIILDKIKDLEKE